MSRDLKSLKENLNKAYKAATPGICLQAYSRGKKVIDVEVGETFKFYDFASLTKIISTTSLLMLAHQNKKLHLDAEFSEYLKWWSDEGLRPTVRQLLNHTAGFPWWLPFYKEMDMSLSRVERGMWLQRKLRELKAEPRDSAVYSDVDFFILGSVLEEIEQRPLQSLFLGLKEKLNLKDTHYHVENKKIHAAEKYAPTENCQWRGKLLRGEVHDENAWALGGVAPHAGLFGTMSDLMTYGLEIRKSLKGSSRVFDAKTARLFTKRSVPESVGDWALGFMMPTKGKSSSGQYFSSMSIGHTGFTGTSLWYDPKKDFLVGILSNRVHPTRHNEEFKNLRPRLHDWAWEYCFG